MKGVTVVVRRRVRPDAVDAFEEWLTGILTASAAFPGHLGASVARPAPGARQDYVVIFRFASDQHLAVWEQSDQRADWLSRVDALTIGQAKLSQVTGLEFWFTLPGHAAAQPPPAWKMAMVTLLGLFPLVYLLAPELRELLSGLPPLWASLLTVATLVALMTWVVMPALIRLARPWLFPKP
ncbi:MAG: antibiotic biosynthesis monooxygenase (ABM) superfamily enzyme [Myxococcota bacterium]|jgi:antibiotic biosynthesis monooxygenase (ABM) superfamily enzyme